MIAYKINERGEYMGMISVQADPQTGEPMLPSDCVADAPPIARTGKRARWDGTKWTEVDATVPEISPEQKLESSDARMIRVIDDLVALLIEKKILSRSDFQEQAIEKIDERKTLRDDLAIKANP